MNRPILTAEEWRAMHRRSLELEADARARSAELLRALLWTEFHAKHLAQPHATATP